MEVINEISDDLYKRLEARRQGVIELDKKIKVEKLLSVYLVNSPKEIEDLIAQANRTVFSTTHWHISLMASRVIEVSEETEDGWDIFLVEKEKQEEYRNPKPIKVYQKDKDKGKGKVGGPPSIKVKDNLPPPVKIAIPKNQPAAESMHAEDSNTNHEVLFTINVDTQNINITVDKDPSEKSDMAKEPPVTGNTEQSTADTGKKMDSEAQTEKLTELKAPEQMPLVSNEVGKPVLKEMQTQTDLPEVNTSMVTSTDTQFVGSPSKSTNVTEVLRESIKKIIDYSSQAYKAIDDSIPILKTIAPNCNIDNKYSLGELDTLCKYISGNMEQIKVESVKNIVEKEKHKFFEEEIKKCNRYFDTLLPELCSLLKEYKNLYKDTCKTNILTVDIDKKISKTQEEINKLADNFVNSPNSLSIFEDKLANFETELLK